MDTGLFVHYLANYCPQTGAEADAPQRPAAANARPAQAPEGKSTFPGQGPGS
jgi:hypothetical protein